MARVAVLTDSTASVPASTATDWGIHVVPLRLGLDGGADHPDDARSREELAIALRAGGTATTSQPSQAALTEAMTAAGQDAEAVVALHLSAELSGTVGVARRAAAEVAALGGPPVHVVDTRTVAGGLGFAAVAAARQAAAGAPVERVLAHARATAARATVLFAVPELQYLARGGRIGPARAFLGSALGARPILAVGGGVLTVLETTRGLARVHRRIAEIAVRAAGGPGADTPRGAGGPVQLAVHHFAAPEAADDLAELLEQRLAETGAQVVRLVRSEVSAVIGAHTGPGVVGVAVAPAEPSPSP
ncbi:MAG TPA: DegV family protein [Actinomycetaceae bacterium]|nr:DegV family protein [Actinomycetaceae bacterium]